MAQIGAGYTEPDTQPRPSLQASVETPPRSEPVVSSPWGTFADLTKKIGGSIGTLATTAFDRVYQDAEKAAQTAVFTNLPTLNPPDNSIAQNVGMIKQGSSETMLDKVLAVFGQARTTYMADPDTKAAFVMTPIALAAIAAALYLIIRGLK